jgi:hypothetical protein
VTENRTISSLHRYPTFSHSTQLRSTLHRVDRRFLAQSTITCVYTPSACIDARNRPPSIKPMPNTIPVALNLIPPNAVMCCILLLNWNGRCPERVIRGIMPPCAKCAVLSFVEECKRARVLLVYLLLLAWFFLPLAKHSTSSSAESQTACALSWDVAPGQGSLRSRC